MGVKLDCRMIGVDGGANRLYERGEGNESEERLPSHIVGDLDTIRPEVGDPNHLRARAPGELVKQWGRNLDNVKQLLSESDCDVCAMSQHDLHWHHCGLVDR